MMVDGITKRTKICPIMSSDGKIRPCIMVNASGQEDKNRRYDCAWYMSNGFCSMKSAAVNISQQNLVLNKLVIAVDNLVKSLNEEV